MERSGRCQESGCAAQRSQEEFVAQHARAATASPWAQSYACPTSHVDLPRQRRLNPTPPPHQPCRIRILHITAGAQERTILALPLPCTTRHLPHRAISLQHIHHGSHQGRLLAPGANTAICPLLLLRRHHSRYALTCRDSPTHT